MSGNKAKILIVEDEAIVGMDIKEALLSLGYEVAAIVPTGEDAVRMASEKMPSLVLMDIMLQGAMNGIEAASIICGQNNIPVVFLTAHADNSTFNSAKATGPYGYVLKPFHPIELRIVIELALHRHAVDKEQQQNYLSNNRLSSNNTIRPNFDLKLFPKNNYSFSEITRITKFLKKIELLQPLDNELVSDIASVCRHETFKAGHDILLSGDKNRCSFIVVSGRAFLLESSSSGKDLIVEIISPGDPFGLLTGIEKEAAPFTIRMRQKTEILWIPDSVIDYLMSNFPELSRRIIDIVLNRLRKAHDLSRTLAHDRVEVRIASALLAMLSRSPFEENSGDSLIIKLSRQELAEMTGTAPETVSRVTNSLDRDGILDLSKPGLVRVVNYQALLNLMNL